MGANATKVVAAALIVIAKHGQYAGGHPQEMPLFDGMLPAISLSDSR
jgi:hypothetical protein